MNFENLNLIAPILSAIKAKGYVTPTPIQMQAIPPILEGRDIMGCAQTGTGKTAAFAIPILQKLYKNKTSGKWPRGIKVLIVTPTRELAIQIGESFTDYGKGLGLDHAVVFGGVKQHAQVRKLKRGVDIIIATPGRLLDLQNQGYVPLQNLKFFTLDEADRMLDMGFIPDIERIFKLTPFTRQTLFFSATMPPEIQRITDQFLSAPARVEVSKPSTTANTITQRIVRLPASDDRIKRETLRKLINESENLKNGIIFCNRKKNVDVVAKSLQKHGFNARPIHGDLPQAFRTETLQSFRDGELTLLVASDVAARGLDIPEVSHVFNYSVPVNAEDYVHRIGRTGRAGREGFTVMLVTPDDRKLYDAVLRTIGVEQIEELDMGDFFETLSNDTTRRPRSRAKATEERRPRGRGRRHHEADDNVSPVTGFGDHIPDFMAG